MGTGTYKGARVGECGNVGVWVSLKDVETVVYEEEFVEGCGEVRV